MSKKRTGSDAKRCELVVVVVVVQRVCCRKQQSARDGSCRTFDAPFSLSHASRVPLHLAIHLTSLESLLIFAEDQAQQRDMMATLRGRPARESKLNHDPPPPPQVAKY